ncbi:MAG TPA: phosphatase PAP2 family protein [Candidatus Paceibacterota bacterium]|nr:phosphatase PAP2 family protein [Candidatus Paceibacterota bacterium]
MERPPKKNRTAEAVVAAGILVALGLLIAVGVASGSAGANLGAWADYYGRTFAGSFTGFVYVTIVYLCLVAMMLVIWSLGKSFLMVMFPALRKGRKDDPLATLLAVVRRSREVWLIIPAILFIIVMALAMGEANEFARARLADAAVIGIEHAIFGNYVFAALGAVRYPHWLIEFIIGSFENMSVILIGAGMVLAYLAPRRFRELIVAFCLGLLIMFPIWLAVPVLSPQDRYIDNVYGLPDPPRIAIAVADYHPQPEIADFLAGVRAQKAGLPALPTSTMPSAHIFWAALAGYYLFRAKKWLGWVALPFLAASSFGTVLLAQHYFADIPAGLAVAALAIWLASISSASRETPRALP